MAEALRFIPVEHVPMVHAIEMSPARSKSDPLPLTLLELVHAVDEVSASESELLATVVHMLQSGRVRLAGSFRDEPSNNILE